MTLAAFLFAILALLLAPGPTNTLMAVAGARGGPGAVLRLLPAEVLGYLAAVLPLALAGAGVLGRWPGASAALTVAAAIWVMLLAVRLWRQGTGPRDAAAVTPARVFITTVLNPKALIFGLVLLPAPEDAGFLPRLALFCLAVLAVAMVWGLGGALARQGDAGGQRLQIVQRAASVWLGVVSVSLVAGILSA